MPDDVALTWNKVTCKTVVLKDHFASHFVRVGEQCVIHNAHFFIRPHRKKRTEKIQTGMHVFILKYHCTCNYRVVYHIGLRETCFLNSDRRAALDF